MPRIGGITVGEDGFREVAKPAIAIV